MIDRRSRERHKSRLGFLWRDVGGVSIASIFATVLAAGALVLVLVALLNL